MSGDTGKIVVGRRLDCSFEEHVRACEALILEEVRKANPDTRIISVLCDSVRLVREHVDYVEKKLKELEL